MHHFSIRDIEHLTGIKAHTLRIWEQRYGLQLCQRKESLHRYYDNEDLKQILRIAHLYGTGARISQIARLNKEDICSMTVKWIKPSCEVTLCIEQLTQAALAFDGRRFDRILSTAIRDLGLEECLVRLIFPFLNKIGLLWIHDMMAPAQEHICSCLIQQKIIAAIDRLPPGLPDSGHQILLFTPQGENHEMPLLLSQYILRKNGHHTIALGRNAAMDTLRYYCSHRPISHLFTYMITNFTCKEPAEYLEELQEQFPGKKIIAAGPAFNKVPAAPGNVVILRSLKELHVFAGKL